VTQQTRTLEQLSGRLAAAQVTLTLIVTDRDVPQQVTRERLRKVREDLSAVQSALRELREVK
jgi:hypothetical protein